MIEFVLNGAAVSVAAPEDTPLLWVVRDELKLKGSKFGCGAGLCGACSMQIDGKPARTCIMPISAIAGKNVVTIEGLGTPEQLSVVQQAWVDHSVAQCGYCQSGQIVAATALLAANPSPSDADIDAAMSGNICRCGTYPAIKRAIHTAAAALADSGTTEALGVHYFDPATSNTVEVTA